jgi:hypothetical protein
VRLAAAVLVLAVVGTAGCGGGGGGGGGGSGVENENKVAGVVRTSSELCDRLDLDALADITGDGWKESKPAKGYVGCEVFVTQGDPGHIYVSVSDVGAGNAELERQFYREETRFKGFGPNIAGLGDRASFNSSDGALVVQTNGVIYKVQYLSPASGGDAKSLAPDRKIYALVAPQ